ncbi:lysophospholipase-like protein 1 [Ischnura elegans]|uniref:lysophospholipase-like protein 1 n=1 Tax=Ischnura elegans TaxID=197161 RepID=UPI001ED8B7CB|nr:lysophospholipase-like protein 1 [Ischnura elegans]
MSALRVTTVRQSNEEATGTVLFLHGSEGSGEGILARIKEHLGDDWQFRHLRILFPTAPVMNYTPLGGAAANVWFDRHRLSPTVPECLESIEASMEMLKQLIEKEIELGIPLHRIIIGGYSMGGAMAMHLTYRMFPRVGGCFAMSSFLNDSSIVYKSLETNTEDPLPPLSMMHGDSDELVPMEWGAETLKQLQRFGVKGTMTIARNVPHELCKEHFINLTRWINNIVPHL